MIRALTLAGCILLVTGATSEGATVSGVHARVPPTAPERSEEVVSAPHGRLASLAGRGTQTVQRASAPPASLTPDSLTDEHITKAIDAIVEELHRRKAPTRFWDPDPWDAREHGSASQEGGHTALVVLALLSAGQSYQEPRLREAIEHLEKATLSGTYAVSFRAQVWAMLPRKYQERLDADAAWLLQGFNTSRRGWPYEHPPRHTWRESNSLRLVGTLGLWEAAKRGVAVDERVWRLIESAWVEAQGPDGGWTYQNNEMPPSASMTAAGVAALLITQDFLHSRDYLDVGGRRGSPAEAAIERGLQWLQTHFDPAVNRGEDNPDYYFYYLYLIERVGLASGRKFFAGHDWFREAAAAVVGRLCDWDEATRTMTARRLGGPGPTWAVWNRNLALGLLFLSRGRVPVAFNKLRGADLAWNNRPRDVANLTAWLDAHSETHLSWQIVDAEEDPQRWLDAPVLYLASHKPLPWLKPAAAEIRAWERAMTARQRGEGSSEPAGAGSDPPAPPAIPQLDHLRRYLDLGGLLLAVSEGRRGFAESIETAGRLMYPHYEWRDLSREHWAYTLQLPVTSDQPRLRALSNGVRELIILVQSPDLAATFQDRTRDAIGHYHTAANVYFYASEMGRHGPRLGRAAEHPRDAAPTAAPAAREVQIVRARYAGNWAPEPAALEAFGSALEARHGIKAVIRDHPLAALGSIDPPPHLVIASGVVAHAFTDAERQAVADLVRRGVTVLFETTGGRGDFTASAESMAEAMLGAPLVSAAASRIVTGRDLPGAARLDRVEYRAFALASFGARETAPRLRGMAVDGELRLLFSREDLCHGVLGRPCWGVSGYGRESATALLCNIVFHAMAPPARE